MLKIEVSNFEKYKKLNEYPFFRMYTIFDISKLSSLSKHAEFVVAINRLRVSNGTYKTTSLNRFGDIDDYLVGILEKDRCYTIHDLAVSDGTTAYELFETLSNGKIEFKLEASDKFNQITEYSLCRVKQFYDSDGKFIYGSFWGLVADKEFSVRFALSKVLGFVLSSFRLKWNEARILLLSPVFQSYLADKISFKELDIFDRNQMSGSYDIIRCMNVLNRSYFTDETILKGLKNIRRMIKTGGLFVIGRTNVTNSMNYASIFRVHENRAVEIKSFGGGSDIKDLVLMTFAVI